MIAMTEENRRGQVPLYGGRYEWADKNVPQRRALSHIRANSRVLEIGTGGGGVTRLLKEHLGCRVVGVDLDPVYAQLAGPYCERFVIGDISKQDVFEDITAGDYDFILFLDVLEHLQRPEELLQRFLRRYERAQTRIVVTLPNLLVWHVRVQLLMGRFEYTDTGTLDRTHLRFFTPASASAMLEQCGFRIVSREHSWHVPVISWIWSKAMLAELDSLDSRVRGRFGKKWARLILVMLGLQRAINRSGFLRLLDLIGRLATRLSPTLFANHVVLVGEPRSL